MQQFKTFHFWLMLAVAMTDFIGASNDMFTAHTIKWVLFAHGLLMVVVQQLAAKWQPSVKGDWTIEEPK